MESILFALQMDFLSNRWDFKYCRISEKLTRSKVNNSEKLITCGKFQLNFSKFYCIPNFFKKFWIKNNEIA